MAMLEAPTAPIKVAVSESPFEEPAVKKQLRAQVLQQRKKVCPDCLHEASYSFAICPRCGGHLKLVVLDVS